MLAALCRRWGTTWLLALLPTLLGCGPIGYISAVSFEAQSALNRAQGQGAETLAPYEYTAAVEYLHKAREVGGYSRYQRATEYAHKARDMAQQAGRLALERAAQPAEERRP